VLIALCRPYRDGGRTATPATDYQIGQELSLDVNVVKTELQALFDKFDLADLSQGDKPVRLVERALDWGLVRRSDL
jgi:hypothetical protein